MSRVISFSAVLGTLALWSIASAAAAEFSLHDAARAGDIAQVRHLLASGAEVDLPEHIDTPLHVAAAADHAEVARLLIAAGADIERPGLLGTPLHVAATTGSIDVVKLLIANGSDIEAIGYGSTPLTYAAEHGHVDVAFALIAAGANVEGGRQEVRTPLVASALSRHLGVVRLLIASGAEINTVDKNCGWTALHFAVENGDGAIVRELLEAGADPNREIEHWGTPLDLAEASGEAGMIALLLGSGARR